MFKKLVLISLVLLLTVGSVVIPSSATDVPPEGPVAAKAVAEASIEAISEKQHPYLMYESDEIEALKTKIESGNSKKAFEVIGDTVASCMSRGFNVTTGANGVIGRQLQYCVTYLSIYSLLTDEKSYAEKAVDQVVSCAQQGNADIYFSINDALCVGDFGTAYALAYDLLYDYMTDDERALIKAEMEEIGAWLYENSPEINTWGSSEENRKAWNWNAVAHGALGMISLSLGAHPEWLTLAVERAQGYYQYSVDSTGAGMEGLHYIGYALNSLAPMDHAIYRLTDIELLDDYKAFQNMTYWSMLYMTTPQGKSQVAINQGDALGNYSGPFYVINRYRQEEALWGWEHTYGLEGDGKFNIEYHGNGWSAPAIIFFEDQTLTPVKPTEDTLPLISAYDKGLVIARDSWENDASMLTFTCGRGYQGCWNHPDDNSFTFHARGESFIIDLGANYKESSEHNVVLIDGKGMDYSGGPTMREGTLEEYTVLKNGNLYLRGSNLSSYKKQDLKASTRQLIYGGGDVPFVLVYDFMRKDNTEHTYNINFFTPTSSTILASPDGDYAKIIGNLTGETCFVIPYSTDGTTISFSAVGSAPCLRTETTSTYLSQATLFIMADEDEMPEVEWSSEGKTITVSITRTINGQLETETYTLGLEELISFSTTEKIDVETTAPEVETTEKENTPETTEKEELAESTEVEVVTTEEETTVAEEITTEKVTEPEITDVPETTEAPVSTTEKVTETEENPTESEEITTKSPESEATTEPYSSENNKKSGCGSSIGAVAIIPAIIAGLALVTFNKKKR